MAEIDDLFREFQARLGPLPQDSRNRILSLLRKKRPRRVIRRPGRLVAVAASLAGLTALGAAAVALRHAGDPSGAAAGTRSDDRSGMAGTVPRVEWGEIATVRVTPDSGVSMEAAMQRTVTAVLHRAAASDVPGVQVEHGGPDTLRVTVPGANGRLDLSGLLTSFSSIAVYDRTSGSTASYTTVPEMKNGLPGLMPSGGYLLVPSTSTDFTNAQWVPTRREADRRIESLNGAGTEGPRWEAVPTPAGHTRLIASAQPSRLDVISDEPILTADDVDEVRADGTGRLIATISAAGRERLSAAVKTGDPVVTFRVAGPYSAKLGRLVVPTGGPPRMIIETPPGTAADWARSLAPAPVPAEVTLASTKPYGTQPMIEGDVVTTLPEPVDRMRRSQLDLQADTPKPLAMPLRDVRRVLTTIHDGREVSVYAARTPAGDDAVYGDLGIGEGNLCTPPVGPPSLMSCPFNFSTMTPGIFLGRIGDPTITAVTVRARSGSYTAVVENGWYLAFIAETDVAPRTAGSVRVTGRSRTGDVIATLDLPAGRIARTTPTSAGGGSTSSSDPGGRVP